MVSLETIAFLIFDGFLLGAIYALFAIGLTLLVSVAQIVNSAHGELYMWSAMLLAIFWPILGLFPSILIVIPLMFAIGGAIDVGIFQRLRKFVKPEETERMSIIVTIILSIILLNLNIYYFVSGLGGGDYWKFVPPLISGKFVIFGFSLPYQRLASAVIAVFMIGMLYSFLRFTRMGKAIRAVAQDREAAMLMGVNINTVNRVTWGIAGVLSAVAGILISSLYVVNPFMGFIMLIKGFAVIIIGGLGSVWGSLIAAFGIAIAENLAGVVISPVYKDSVAFFIMIAILLIKGRGLFAKT
ncbi:MAG: branched-chain amino acid ABC transporter permease [Candidatus Hodarchaeota archaeon]